MSLARKVEKYDKEARSGIYTGQGPLDPRKGGNMTMQYPRRGFEAFDPRDEMMRVKMDLIEKGQKTGMTKYGLVTVTEEDLNWLAKKRETEAKFNFDRWVGDNFNTNDVVTRQWLQETYPEYHDVREQTLVDRAKFALRVHLLMMRGPKNHKDLVLYWGLQQGLIKLDRDWDKIGAGVKGGNVNMDKEQKRFANGLMNPWRYKDDTERRSNMKGPNNPFSPGADESGGGGGIPGGFGINVGTKNRYSNFYDTVLRGSLFGKAEQADGGVLEDAQETFARDPEDEIVNA